MDAVRCIHLRSESVSGIISRTENASRLHASGKFNRAVVVAMIAVWMMQVAVDQIVDMIALRHRLMSASGPVNVIRGMGATIMVRRTSIRIFPADLDPILPLLPAGGDVAELGVKQVVAHHRAEPRVDLADLAGTHPVDGGLHVVYKDFHIFSKHHPIDPDSRDRGTVR